MLITHHFYPHMRVRFTISTVGSQSYYNKQTSYIHICYYLLLFQYHNIRIKEK